MLTLTLTYVNVNVRRRPRRRRASIGPVALRLGPGLARKGIGTESGRALARVHRKLHMTPWTKAAARQLGFARRRVCRTTLMDA